MNRRFIGRMPIINGAPEMGYFCRNPFRVHKMNRRFIGRMPIINKIKTSMRGFFKIFFAALLALAVFTVIFVFGLVGYVAGRLSPKKPDVGGKAVLVIDLGQSYREQMQDNPLSDLGSDDQYDVPGLYDLVRLLRHAKEDTAIRGLYLKCNDNPNGIATNEEIRHAVADFKKSGKFVYSYGDVISQ